MYQSVEIRIAIALVSLFLYLISMIGLVGFTSNKNWWLTLNELETKKNEYKTLINEALEVRDTLTRKIIREDKNNDFIISALNAYWNDAHAQLQRKDLGDIERENYMFQMNESKRIMKELE
jgi:hypothetical protein